MAMQNEANANRVGASGAVEAAIQNIQSGLDLSTADMALKEHDPGLVRQQSMCTPLQRLTNTLDPCALCKEHSWRCSVVVRDSLADLVQVGTALVLG